MKLFNGRRIKYLLIVLAAMVIFTTTYSLILPAITLEATEAETIPGLVLDEGDKGALKSKTQTSSQEKTENKIEETNADAEKATTAAAQAAVVSDAEKEDASQTLQKGSVAENADKPSDASGAVSDTEKNKSDTSKLAISAEKETAASDDKPALIFEAEIRAVGATVTAEGMQAEELKNPKEQNVELKQIVLKVKAEADEGTFSAGTAMKIKEVSDDQQVQDMISDAVDGSIKTMQAVDISFFDKDGNEIEPAKDIRVTITSDTIKTEKDDNDADPVIVHLPDRGDAEIIKAVDENTLSAAENPKAEEVVFENNAFSVYAIVYTVDVASLVDGEAFAVQATDAASYPEFTINISPDGAGKISAKNSSSEDVTEESIIAKVKIGKDNNGYNNGKITAKPNAGYVFDYWELDGKRVTDITGTEIKDGTNGLFIGTSGTHILTAVFRSVSSIETAGNEEYIRQLQEELARWAQGMTSDSVHVDKTAQAYDYTNRIYQINLSASSGVRRVMPSIDLEFIVDISRSMYFPATLTPVTQNGNAVTFTQGTANAKYNDSSLYDWLTTYGDKNTVYYVVGADSSATVTALYYGGNVKNPADSEAADEWRYMDSSNFNAPDNKNYAGKTLSQTGSADYFGNNTTGILYTAVGTLRRQDYLVAAVKSVADVLYAIDPNARIGLVTFYKDVENKGFFTKEQKDAFITAMTTVTLEGGTNQQKGLETGKALFEQNDKKKTAILITDGAPNQSGVTWDTIGTAANDLKNKYGTGSIDLYTLGLSLSMVGEENRNGMKNIATGADYYYSAESGMDVLTAMERIIEKIINEASLKGTVIDTIDEAFYPVTKDGARLEDGDKINLQGEKTTNTTQPYGTVKYDSTSQTYYIEWMDQNIPYSTTGNGWAGAVYVKAKEDFLGGNTIKTNGGVNDNFTATKYIVNNTEYSVEEGRTIGASFETPYVNVDELALNKNDTEWTVYLGTNVDPMEAVKELYNNMKVREVVSQEDSDHRRSSESKKITEEGFEANTFLLSALTGTLTEEQWKTLKDTGALTIPYTGYNSSRYGDDNMGNIVIALTKDGTGCDYNAHNANTIGTPVETYILKAEYQPSAVNYNLNYHTTPGGSAGDATGAMNSANTHKINVFAKSIRLTKTDETFNNVLAGAKFALYRTARSGEAGNPLSGAEGSYVKVADLDCSETGVVTKQFVASEKLNKNEKYYIIETQAPAGYNMLAYPIEVTFCISDSYAPVSPAGDVIQTKPETGLFNWTESAVLSLAESSGVRRTDESGTEDLTHSGNSGDSKTDTGYYRIMNNPGYVLPATGGSGATGHYLLGLSLIVLAGILKLVAIYRSRKL